MIRHLLFSGCRYLIVLYKFVFFMPMTAFPKIRGSIFDFSATAEQRNFTGKQDLNALLYLCVSGRSEKEDCHQGLWLSEIFSTCLQPLNGIGRNLTGNKYSTSCPKFRVYRKPKIVARRELAHTFLPFFLESLNQIDRSWDFQKLRWSPVLLFAETILTSSLQPLNRIEQNITGHGSHKSWHTFFKEFSRSFEVHFQGVLKNFFVLSNINSRKRSTMDFQIRYKETTIWFWVYQKNEIGYVRFNFLLPVNIRCILFSRS